MKKIMVLTAALMLSSVAIFAQTVKSKLADTAIHKVYTCTMHPEVISDKPGKCPKCGMALVEKKTAANGMSKSTDKMPMRKKDSSMAKKKIS
ncbi:MAG TPA: heavy metal-binding domain-containing protein [Puia sp.]|nr:heavy metal-binding domain-containing protein [Puia sp.]